MTIKAAASAIMEDLVASGSFHRTQVSACDYGILSTPYTAGCGVILRPGFTSGYELIAFGGVTEDTMGILADGYVRQTGQSTPMMTRVWDMHDALKAAIDGGSSGNTNTRIVQVVSISHNPDEFFDIRGHHYARVRAQVRVKEDP